MVLNKMIGVISDLFREQLGQFFILHTFAKHKNHLMGWIEGQWR